MSYLFFSFTHIHKTQNLVTWIAALEHSSGTINTSGTSVITIDNDLSEVEINSGFIFIYIFVIIYSPFLSSMKIFIFGRLPHSTDDVGKNCKNQWYHFAAGAYFCTRKMDRKNRKVGWREGAREMARQSFLPAEESQHLEDSSSLYTEMLSP